MKIGILTFHRAINYGAFLQAFALKTYLELLGNRVDIIDYWPKEHQDEYKKLSIKNVLQESHSCIEAAQLFLHYILDFGRSNKRITKMEQLVSKYFNVDCKKIEYQNRLDLSSLEYDAVVYGSDQVWWKYLKMYEDGFDPVYWGEIVHSTVKKIAYAPSMGIINLDEKDKSKLSSYLNNFTAISVREGELKSALQPLTRKEITHVIDPVFLLQREQWNKVCKPVKYDKYVLLYSLIPSDEAIAFAKKLCREKCLKYVEITGFVKPLKIGTSYVQTVDAFDFISLIRNAEYVVTTSFHGTAFSLIFEKQFFSMGMGKKAGRVQSLLNLLGIEERLVNTVSDISLIDNDINYKVVSSSLNDVISSSKMYLTKNLA